MKEYMSVECWGGGGALYHGVIYTMFIDTR